MLLTKINRWRPYKLWRDYAAWLAFCAALMGLTNASSSLDKIRAYGIKIFDVFLTFGFIIAWGILESAAAAGIMTFVQIWFEKATEKNLDLLFRFLMIFVFVLCWILLLLRFFI
jgi:hypothetical protein